MRMQLFVELPRAADTTLIVDALMWLVDQGFEHGQTIGGFDRADPRADLGWVSDIPGQRSRVSQGRGERRADIARFESTMRSADRGEGRLTWTTPGGPSGAISIATWLEWFGDRPQLHQEWLWTDRAPNGVEVEVERAALSIATEVDGVVSPKFLILTDDLLSGVPALDRAQGRASGTRSVEPGQLRSYAWTTRLSASQIAAVGGWERLEAEGTFVSVHRCRDGAGLLLATEHLRDYVGPRVAEVRATLANIIPTGEMKFRFDGFRLAWDDGTAGPFVPPMGDVMRAG